MSHDFEDIEVKSNAASLLEAELKKRRRKCVITTGSMSDPYIHLEEQLRVTRECLSVIEKHGFGLAIQTKSSLILRDIDLLTRINQKAKCVVQMTLTTYDENLCKIVEPCVSSTRERFKVLLAMKEAGIPTVVWLSPILPRINDSEENLLGLMDYCAKAGVFGIICFGFGLTLRSGNREYFFAKLTQHYPGVKDYYLKEFANSYSCLSPNNSRLKDVFLSLCRQYGILCDSKAIFSHMREFRSNECQLQLV